MKNKPLFTGIAGGIEEVDGVTVENLLGKSGLNTGNFLFVKALREQLGSSADVFRDESYYKARINEYDYIAISAANWVSSDTDLTQLVDFIESTNLPCLLVGLGGQVEYGAKPPKLKEGTQRFLDVVSERSKFISVRGKYTQDLLSHYGIKNTWVTGCPSILGNGNSFSPIVKTVELLDLKKVVVQGTRHGFSDLIFAAGKSQKFNLDIYRFALENNCKLLLQSEVADIYFSMGRDNNKALNERNSEFLEKVYSCSSSIIKSYLRKNGLIFWELNNWFDSLSKFQFLIGTRIHGVVSALLAGVPAVLIAHDERTKELAEAMNIPFVDMRNHDSFDEAFIRRVYLNVSFERLNSGITDYSLNFKKFYEANNVMSNL